VLGSQLGVLAPALAHPPKRLGRVDLTPDRGLDLRLGEEEDVVRPRQDPARDEVLSRQEIDIAQARDRLLPVEALVFAQPDVRLG
jgi:hypothetical protein